MERLRHELAERVGTSLRCVHVCPKPSRAELEKWTSEAEKRRRKQDTR